MILPDPEPWMAEATCAQIDGDLWFPEKGVSSREAKRVCQSCPVVQQCLAYALEHDEAGIWGGTSEQQRRSLRPSRKAA